MSRELADLLTVEGSPKLTLLMPTNVADTKQDLLRLKELTSSAQKDLSAWDLPRERSRGLIEPALLLESSPRWRSRSQGIALCSGDGYRRAFSISDPSQTIAYVGRDFLIAPLVAPLDGTHCYVLTLSRGGVQLRRATRGSLKRMELPGAPADLDEVTRLDDPEKQLQFHQAGQRGRSATIAVYHGHGIGEGKDSERVREFLRHVHTAVSKAIGTDVAPLLVVGPDDIPSMYGDISGDRHGQITQVAHPKGLSDTELQSLAIRIIDQTVASRRAAASDRYDQLAGTGKTSADIAETLVAATDGRVHALLYSPSATAWGSYQPALRQVSIHEERQPDSEELINRCVAETARHGGAVVPAEGSSPVRAIYRY